jgi:hypothetical protein
MQTLSGSAAKTLKLRDRTVWRPAHQTRDRAVCACSVVHPTGITSAAGEPGSLGNETRVVASASHRARHNLTTSSSNSAFAR